MTQSLDERIELISEDRVHGAGWLARQAVEALADAAAAGQDPVQAGRRLAQARPAIGAIAAALGRLLVAGRTTEQLIEECRALIDRRDRAATSIAVLLRPEIEGRVLTHSASATVLEALVHATPERVVCTVSAPHEEGRDFADVLAGAGLTVDLVADEDAERALETVDVLLVGADCVFRDGSLVNKAGTAGLAAAAKGLGLPVLVACETIKVAPVDPAGGWEDPDPAEEPFDLTAPDLIDCYATDEGLFPPDEIAALVDRTPFLREGYALVRGPLPES
jgi:translation initiation factor eIF-2B subunit delta/methylthioribose-1-phosphate isomerase